MSQYMKERAISDHGWNDIAPLFLQLAEFSMFSIKIP